MFTESNFIFNNSEITTPEKGSFTWRSPSNIALVKYWGKSEPQIPKNSSISFTLNNCHTITSLEYNKREKFSDKFDITVFFEGKIKEDFKPKIETFFERISEYVPYIKEYKFIIKSENSFPHSSGIASSASGMSAIALCIMSIEKKINPKLSNEFFNRKASFLARLGSGSACRSIDGPLVVWGQHPEIQNSSNLYGTAFSNKLHPVFKNYQDVILLVDKGEKQVSSSVGHNLMQNHPFSQQRFSQANNNLSKLLKTLDSGDINEFIHIVENEALTLHAMMMTSSPYFILMKPNTLKIIEKIWEFRRTTNSSICFTLDAGANVHVLFPEREKEIIKAFILKELLPFCQNNHYIWDSLGNGAEIIE